MCKMAVPKTKEARKWVSRHNLLFRDNNKNYIKHYLKKICTIKFIYKYRYKK